ncbi:MAG: DUF1294 domain-containing protein [Phycisphaerales bacterium]|nr:DUF1294 domain-containing protein [Phycisphaerales bacterium]
MTWIGIIGGWYVLAGAVSFALYAADKRRASRGRRRIPERALHITDALGGWIGGAIARQTLRHKTRKAGFFIVSWAIALAHLGAWGALLWLRSRP